MMEWMQLAVSCGTLLVVLMVAMRLSDHAARRPRRQPRPNVRRSTEHPAGTA